ncbi:hypothetical protein B0T26DRAFT_746982 [Lasiosphaeria miniovina]|uniref:Uncharacterized protein n=1 Tax=Lasiosphaeria miniovina TaxID=1954250 RepID=A0AA40BJ22_9PEZI|nr:uncharacterized protein B0T26DRAFT_746982 [Lasiosphaeria miniovina]KAK0735164.1 hypothetical protein B0T26DRAFT_746982 [Lasiosphaeria miniovina]
MTPDERMAILNAVANRRHAVLAQVAKARPEMVKPDVSKGTVDKYEDRFHYKLFEDGVRQQVSTDHIGWHVDRKIWAAYLGSKPFSYMKEPEKFAGPHSLPWAKFLQNQIVSEPGTAPASSRRHRAPSTTYTSTVRHGSSPSVSFNASPVGHRVERAKRPRIESKKSFTVEVGNEAPTEVAGGGKYICRKKIIETYYEKQADGSVCKVLEKVSTETFPTDNALFDDDSGDEEA